MIKKIMIPVIAVVISGAALLGVSQAVQAQSNNEPFSGLVKAIAQKFNLDQNQVQSVFDEYKQEHKADMDNNRQQRLESELNQAVKDGKINESQKKAILDKLASLKDKLDPESLKNKTPEERKQTMQNHRNDLQNWAKDQGIDLSVLKFGMGFGKGHMRGGF